MIKKFTKAEREDWLRNLPGNPSSGAVILENDKGELLTVKTTYKDYWTFPGGVVDAGESPRHAALREVKEEIGVTLPLTALRFICVFYRKGPARDTYQFIFGAPIDTSQINSIVLQASEIEAYAFVSKQQVANEKHLYAPAIQAWADGSLGGYGEQILADD